MAKHYPFLMQEANSFGRLCRHVRHAVCFAESAFLDVGHRCRCETVGVRSRGTRLPACSIERSLEDPILRLNVEAEMHLQKVRSATIGEVTWVNGRMLVAAIGIANPPTNSGVPAATV